MQRKSRSRTLPPSAFLRPIHIQDLGDPEKDPCFGKHYDLTAVECQSCGDSEYCAVVLAQRLRSERTLEEKKGRRLDLEMGDQIRESDIKKFYEGLKSDGESSLKAFKRTRVKFNLSKDKLKTLLNGKHS